MTATIIEATKTYKKLITDLVTEYKPEITVYKADLIDACAALEMRIYSDIYIFDDILDADGDFVDLARNVNDKINFIIISSSGKRKSEISNKYNLSEDVILTKPFVFSEFETALNVMTNKGE